MITLICEDQNYTVRGPIFNNTETAELNTLFGKAMDNTVYSFANPSNKRILQFSFQQTNRPKAYAYLNFVDFAMGKNVLLIDFDSRIWRGKFTEETLRAAHQGVYNNTFSITFEGERINA